MADQRTSRFLAVDLHANRGLTGGVLAQVFKPDRGPIGLSPEAERFFGVDQTGGGAADGS